MYLTQNVAQILAEHKPWNHENEKPNVVKQKWTGASSEVSDQVEQNN
jgi:hypothetical protein